MFSEIIKERLGKFKGIRRAYYAFCLLGFFFFVSLFSEFLANEKPIYVYYKETSFVPIFFFYAGKSFGQEQDSVADYTLLRKDKAFLEQSFVIWPPYPHGPYHSYFYKDSAPPNPPSLDHFLGTDRLGRDVLARLLYGFRISMLFALCLTFLMGIFGLGIGGIQGYGGGWLDLSLQRFIEMWAALPFLYVVILLGSLYGRDFKLLVFTIALFNWIGLSYYMRAEFLRGKKQVYVQAARALGLSKTRIFLGHILPNSLSPMITILPFGLISGITILTALDFLGFGLQAPTPSWGELLKQGLDVIREYPHLTITTILALFLTLSLATLIGEGVREAFDPRSGKHIE